MRGKRNPILKNGWFVVKRPDTPGLLSGVGWEDAQSQEEAYFSTGRPWCTAELKYRSNYGSQNLVNSLSELFCEAIRQGSVTFKVWFILFFGCSSTWIRLPKLQLELRTLQARARADLTQLPEQTRNHVVKASKKIRDFLSALEKHLEGTPGRNGLHQSIRQPFLEFVTAIRAAAPDFRPYSSSLKSAYSGAILPYPKFTVNNNKVRYLDEVKELANV